MYPARAAQGLGELKAHSNELEIFVEDKSQRRFWLLLLQRYAPNINLKIGSINPLGGRDMVLEACRCDQTNNSRKRLYIIDSDFDIVLQKRKERLKHLYKLKRYCVENYLVSQSSIDGVALTLGKKDTDTDINIERWVKDNEDILKELFVCYAVAYDLSFSGEPTVSYGCHRLLDNNNYCREKVEERIFSLYESMRNKFGSDSVEKTKEAVRKQSVTLKAIEMCSAKDYIIPVLFNMLKRSIGINSEKKVFIRILASFADEKIDPKLTQILNKAAK